ncbi:MAG: tetratricopeptide repeat protein [Chthoniobacterales bacterium]
MARKRLPGRIVVLRLFLLLAAGTIAGSLSARPSRPGRSQMQKVPVATLQRQDDSLSSTPATDLALSQEGQRKANALASFVEGARLEEDGETEEALAAYRNVLNVDPGQAALATRVAALLGRDEDFPQAIDVLKDAIKANPKAVAPYLQLSFIYARFLKKTDQALKYANAALALDPQNVEAYQRLYDIYVDTGNPKKALGALEGAAQIQSSDPVFWTRLGKLYASIVTKDDAQPKPDEMRRLKEIFKRAADNAHDDPAVLKDVADFYGSSQQIQEAIPLYLRVLELQPDDPNAREKLATGFVLTNQRARAVEMLEAIIKLHPERYQAYDLLAQLLDEDGRTLAREKHAEEAKTQFAKAAANYEQSLLINPERATSSIRLAELLIGPLKQGGRAIRLLIEARQRFAGVPEFTYLLALAQREAKRPEDAVATFEEARHEAEASTPDLANARFYFEYAAAAEQARLYDKAADLFKKSIALDPPNAAEACNYLGFMWVDQNTHLEEAGELIQRALQLDPNNGAYLDSLGWLHFRQGNYADALNELLRAAQNLGRDDPVVFEHIGDACAKLNRVPQALDYWQKAVSLDPANRTLAEKIDGLKTKMSKAGPS